MGNNSVGNAMLFLDQNLTSLIVVVKVSSILRIEGDYVFVDVVVIDLQHDPRIMK